MRSFATCLALSVALTVLPVISANALDAKAWQQDQTAFGANRWTCQAAGCGIGSVVNYQLNPFNPVFTLLDYESLWKARARNPKSVPQAITHRGLFLRINSYDETDGELRHYTIILRHRETNGVIDYFAVGYMARGLQAYELVSIATTADQAEANLKRITEDVRQKFKT